jgi:hypothetical protein
MTSDGVYDNYDPQYLGIQPSDLHVGDGDWKSIPTAHVNGIKGKFITRAVQQRIHESTVNPTPRRCVVSMLRYCVEATKPTREWMEAHPGKALPKNFRAFPGQLDHATCLTFRVSTCSQRSLDSNVDLWDFHLGVEELVQESSGGRQSTSLTELPVVHPVSFNVPISVLVTRTQSHVMLFCRPLARTRLEVIDDETCVILRFHRALSLRNYHRAIVSHARLHGIDELGHALERSVDLPVRIVPATRTIKHDHTLGLIVIRYAQKRVAETFGSK